jgi:2-iminobutanoate/2-iminopropanoate deaminase
VKKIIFAPKAPKPIGPYSQAVEINGFLFVSGQIPLDAQSGQIVSGSLGDQTRKVLENLKAILEAAGTDFSAVVKTTIFLQDLKFFDEINEVYAEYFKETKPARSTVQISGLPKGAGIEIDAIAVLKR